MARSNRTPFDHEAAVDWNAIRGVLDRGFGHVLRIWGRYRQQMIGDYCDQLGAIDSIGQLPRVNVRVQAAAANMAPEIAAILARVVEDSSEVAVAEAKRQGVTAVPAAPSEGVMTARAVATVAMIADHVSVAGDGHTLRLTQGPVDEQVVARVRGELRNLSWSWVADQLNGAVAAAANWGRVETLRPPDISAVTASSVPIRWYASELLDAATCDPCGDIDGRPYVSLQAALADYPAGGFRSCRGLTRCRGTLVAVYDV